MKISTGLTHRAVDRRVYIAGAAVAIVLVFIGFARTFFLKFAFGTPSLPLLLHLHGWVMAAWFTLFAVQASLIATGNVNVHKRLGVFGACLAIAVVTIGSTVAINAARLGHGPPGIPSAVFLIVPLTDMLVFTLLAGSAMLLRQHSDYHKRLMLLATLSILTAAIGRILRLVLDRPVMAAATVMIIVVLACVVWDTWRNRRLHPAFFAGAILIIVSWPLRIALSQTSGWRYIADWLFG